MRAPPPVETPLRQIYIKPALRPLGVLEFNETKAKRHRVRRYEGHKRNILTY